MAMVSLANNDPSQRHEGLHVLSVGLATNMDVIPKSNSVVVQVAPSVAHQSHASLFDTIWPVQVVA
jgi:hypothetical protein